MNGLAHGVRIARVAVVRTVRKHTDDAPHLFGVAVLGLMVGATAVGGGLLARFAGTQLRIGGELTTLPVVAGLRGAVALLWLLFAGVFAVRAFGRRGSVGATGGLLVVVPTVEVVTGVMLSELVFATVWTAIPALAVGSGLALGSRVVLPVVAVPVAILATAATAVAVGYPVGLALRHLVSRVEFVARHRNALVVAAFLTYLWLLVTGTVDRLAVALFEPMQRTPVAWYADLALVGTPGVTPSPLRAAGGLALPAVVVPLSVAAAERVAGVHWFADPVLAGEGRPHETVRGGRRTGWAHRTLERVAGRATAALVVLAYRRAYRAPLKLLYAAYPLFLVVGFVPSVVETGRLPAAAPVAVLLFVAWGAGSAFVLNPLGDQGAGLPTVLLSPVTGRSFVRAHVLASLLVAVPVGTVATAAVAWASPSGTAETVAAVVAAPVVATLGSAAAVGIGVAFPRFEAVNVTRSTEAVVPSKTAFLLFSAYLLATAGTGAVVVEATVGRAAAALVTWLLPAGLSVSPVGLSVAAGTALVVLSAVPVASYRYAVGRFDGYTLD